MTFEVRIDTDNAAFRPDDRDLADQWQDGRCLTHRRPLSGDECPDCVSEAAAPELARILRQIARTLHLDRAAPLLYRTIRDVNGNDVGRYALKGRTA